jgi:hypothetical protein
MKTSTRTTTRGLRSRGRASAVIHGFVSPAGWDEDGQVVAVCIVDDQGYPCFVLPGGAESEVRGHLKRYVSATGQIEIRRGVPFVMVDSVRLALDPNWSLEPE